MEDINSINNSETNSLSELDYHFSDIGYDEFHHKAQATIKVHEPASEKQKPFCRSERVKLLIPEDMRDKKLKETESFLVNPHAILGQVNFFYDDYEIELKAENFTEQDIIEMKKYDLDFLMLIYQQLNSNYDVEYKQAVRKHKIKKNMLPDYNMEDDIMDNI